MFSTNNYILTRALTRQFIERKFLNAAGDYMTYLQIRNPSDLFYVINFPTNNYYPLNFNNPYKLRKQF